MTLKEAHELFDMAGIKTIPLKENKAPMMPKGSKYLYEPCENEKKWDEAKKIGIICGELSDNLLTIDFDAHNKQPIKDIFREYNNCEQMKYLIKSNQIGVYKTPSGGYHLYFHCEQPRKGQELARWEDNQVMIETRGHGQYAAAFPSAGYTKIAGADVFNLSKLDDDVVDYLLERATTFSQIVTPKEVNTGDNKEKRQWPDKFDDSKPIGKFNNEGADIAKELLQQAGWQLVPFRANQQSNIEYFTRPNKSIEDGISASFGHYFNMFYCFTKNGLPFEEGKGYSPFEVLRILKFNGDFNAALEHISPKQKIKVELDTTGETPEKIKHLFPVDVFPDYFRDFILKLNQSLNYHVDFSSVALLFTISTAVGNKIKLRVKTGWETPMIFWFAALGEPGTIKSHPLNTMIKPLKNIDRRRKNTYDKDYDVWQAGDKKSPAPTFKQTIVTDATLEALHFVHSVNKRAIGLHKDELVGFLNDMNKYRKGSDEQFWLESFNNSSYMINRVTKRTLLIENICINIIGTMQPDVLQKIAAEQVENGLLDRFLFTSTEDQVYPITDAEIEQNDLKEYEEIIQGFDSHFRFNDYEDTTIIEMSKEAFKEYQRIDGLFVEIQNSETETKRIINYLSKMKTYIPRFALAIAVLEHVSWGVPLDVTEDHMKKAYKMAEYFINTARAIFEGVDKTREIKDVDFALKGKTKKEKIIELYKKGFKQTDISKQLNTFKSHVSKVISEYEGK